MALIGLQDIQGRTLIELGRYPNLPLATAASYTLFKTPSGTYGGAGGMLKTIVFCVVATAPVGATAATCTIGSGGTNDWAASAVIAVPAAGFDTILYPVAGIIAYAPGVLFQVTVGTPGVGTMTHVAYGWTE